MSKTVQNTHITGEIGVIKFLEYCNRHKPYIIFRETLKNDFGLDGEIEITRTNNENKIEPTGEIIKIQIKSVNSAHSYIKNENAQQFEFHPRKDDIEYWKKYKSNGIEVLIVIYDERSDKLFCKKIFDVDLYTAQQRNKTKGRKNINSILFDKNENLLNTGESNFSEKYSINFKQRVNYDCVENLQSNFMILKTHPKYIYCYSSKYKNKKEIFENVTNESAPYFVVYNSVIYTFQELNSDYKVFKESILAEPNKAPAIISYSQILNDIPLRNHFIELINEHMRVFLWRKQMSYEKKFRRYYFRLPKDENELIIHTKTRKREQSSSKAGVKYLNYGKLSSFRHLAVEFSYFFNESNLFIILTPKYLFTIDGKVPVDGAIATKLTNYLTSREYNNHYCDWLHFWRSYLSDHTSDIVIYEHPYYKNGQNTQIQRNPNKYPRLVLGNYQMFDVKFGIPIDKKGKMKMDERIIPEQSKLFKDES